MDLTTIYFICSDVLALAFGAGAAFALLRRSKKDVNGLGKKVNREIARSSTRHQNLTIALMLLAADEKRKVEIADLLKESHEEGES